VPFERRDALQIWRAVGRRLVRGRLRVHGVVVAVQHDGEQVFDGESVLFRRAMHSRHGL